jgi:hypothetical protein
MVATLAPGAPSGPETSDATARGAGTACSVKSGHHRKLQVAPRRQARTPSPGPSRRDLHFLAADFVMRRKLSALSPFSFIVGSGSRR